MERARKLPSGKYQARLTEPNGTRRSLGTFDTKKAAERVMAKATADISRGTYDDGTRGTILFTDFAAQYLKLATPSLAPRTVDNYERHIRLYLDPTFGKMRLRDIKAIHVDTWWAELMPQPQNRTIYNTLCNIFKAAIKYEELLVTPCAIKGATKDTGNKKPYYSPEQVWAVIDECGEYQTLFTVAFGGALRIGEVMGLNRGHVDIWRGTVTIDQQFAKIAGGMELRPPKNGESRTINLPEVALTPLREHWKKVPALPKAPVWQNASGGRVHPHTLYEVWNAARERAGVPTITIHDLRHSSLTAFAQGGATMAETMARAGHKDPRSALRYQHATLERDAHNVEQMSAAIMRKAASQ